MRKLAVTILLTPFLAACEIPIDLGRLPPPPEKMVCRALPDTPTISPLQAIPVDGVLVYKKADVDARDGVIAGWIVNVTGAWFDCSNTVGWHKDYWAD
jgi:hypothetical protein